MSEEILKIPYVDKNISVETAIEKAATIHLNSHNWAETYPESAQVEVKIWHTNENIFLNFEVEEKYVLALTNEDNGNVYKDSCVEFFISFDPEGYYNIETNCGGTILMSHRKSRNENVVYSTPELLKKIKRFPSLGCGIIELSRRETGDRWNLLLQIPTEAFFKHEIQELHGLRARGNFYKCGDNLPGVHFMSWLPINTETPDFHRPEYFGDIQFE